MKKSIEQYLNSVKIRKTLLLILLLSFCIPNLNPIIVPAGIKLFRIVTIGILLFYAIVFKKIKIPSWIVIVLFLGISVVSVLNYRDYGFERMFFEYIFAIVVLIMAYSLGYGLKLKDFTHIIKNASLFLMVVIILNLVLQYESIFEFYINPTDNHPNYNSVFSGGCNIDATWLALFVLFYRDDLKTGYVYGAFSLLISSLLASRIGVILSFVCLLYLIYNHIVSKFTKTGRAIIMVLTTASIVIAATCTGAGGVVMDRIRNVGQDDASLSRMSLWENGMETVGKNLYGYGAGNAVKAIERNSNISFDEDNVHNLYLQKTLDFGVMGFVVFLLMIYVFVKETYKEVLKNPLYAYIYLYLIAGMLQFKGADSLVFYMLGLCCVILKQNEKGAGDGSRTSKCLNDGI